MHVVKKLIKTGLQWTAPRLGRHRLSLHRHNLLILTYHRILPLDDERLRFEQPGMYVTPATLTLQLKFLKKYFVFSKLSEWLQQSNEQPQHLPNRSCVITFDDGWRDNYDYAFPVLQQEQVPATLFLVSSLIGTHYDFWPGRLARLLHHTAHHQNTAWQHAVFDWLKKPGIRYRFTAQPPTPEELDEIIQTCKRNSDPENNRCIDAASRHTGLTDTTTARNLLDENEIQQMLNSGLITLGSHTAHHIRMTDTLSQTELHAELIHSKQQLETRFKTSVPLFCYPNGDTTDAAIQLVQKNYLGACTTRRGWNTPHSNPHLLRRINMHEDMSNTPQKLLTKISGWL